MNGSASSPDDIVVVLSTAPASSADGKHGAHELVEALLRERLCACGNVVPGVVSHYWWNGALERSSEALLVLKTTRGLAKQLCERLVALHPYEVPEALVMETNGGHAPYLDWVRAETSPRLAPREGTA